MKTELKILIWAHIALVLFLCYETFDLMTLLYDDTFKDSLLDSDLNSDISSRPQLIPKIIHQTYKTNDIPEIWQDGQKKCQELHPDYKYIMWTDEMARNFISEEYPWFLKTFDSYKYNIERADSIRYFVLNHFGGIYIDLDDGCARRLDPLLSVPAFVRKTTPSGISNDVMGSVPRHPFFIKTIKSLESYNRNWLVPYITIMYSTGPLFLSVIWKQYKRWGVPESGVVRILQPADYKSGPNAFFNITEGSSWHLGDAKFIKSLADHIGTAVIGGFLIAIAILSVEFAIYLSLVALANSRAMKKCISFIKDIPSRFSRDSEIDENKVNNHIYKIALLKRRNRKDSNLPVVHIDVADDIEKQIMNQPM
ncbi:Mannosylinositol phosphorylceramide synthase catalytic subunit [Komagataella phaffii CBS 7435]|uniref:inositol phosphorylceramide mannosyltransferase n=2 Tax=Komagataella phaffii TaxID=460519 RepID=C4QVK8_KOMPG|nr:putative catalytic subunit of a mannosylinositol phosphorylceramide (MIPC) synthase [Komagataella phaffii GS115]AOA60439.1 GQ67_02477T0 [Komagataella phaffii]CAH2445937.1 Mannosylinositol phosphorylceramide synthase catalytic subunit [Komagataella phaffii CBS 7435]AOA65589.1 GQ68_02770T0 [Komagataella phaffii GS115]CAY67281.1 Probable catalytic subunit of a mannosylinositol phosphorylceramide (MIPC) synthase [Komagataella phaffii GS115]CCA36384.1 Mannosylinositol phosphorylceramide synthase